MAHPTQQYILKWSKSVAPKVRHLAFARADNQPVPFTAGQFITLHIEAQGKILHRSYSIANTPAQNNQVELACSFVEGGVASTLLFGMQPGDTIQASGPFGLFVLKEEQPTRYILIATGTGVTPYRSMLNDIKHRLEQTHPTLEVIVVLGVRNPEELLFGDEFVAFGRNHPQFKFYACYSREGRETLEAHERLGRLQSVLPELNLNPANDIVYLCGNPNMIDDSFELLTQMGFDRKSVRREKYSFSH